MIAVIIKVFPLMVRDYQDRDGRPLQFKSKGFVMLTDHDSFYVEALQDWAEHHENTSKPNEGDVVSFTPTFRCREYKTAQGETRFSNEVTITNLQFICRK